MRESVAQREYREHGNEPLWVASEIDRLKVLSVQQFRPLESLNGIRIRIRFLQRRLRTLLTKPSVQGESDEGL